ncbi:hypothetical protein ACFXOI_28690 [Streptomyces bacillaris]|uniref:hypothetical protein n=1 Tax=Streptomyces bacillaris TaxID=68179 RepID=UPI0036AEE198
MTLEGPVPPEGPETLVLPAVSEGREAWTVREQRPALAPLAGRVVGTVRGLPVPTAPSHATPSAPAPEAPTARPHATPPPRHRLRPRRS